MAFTITGKNKMLDYAGTQCGYMALFTDIAGTTEVTGAPYARKPITWNPAANGSKSISNQPVFDVPAGVTVRAIGIFTALTGGDEYGFDDVTAETWAGNGTYTVASYSGSIV